MNSLRPINILQHPKTQLFNFLNGKLMGAASYKTMTSSSKLLLWVCGLFIFVALPLNASANENYAFPITATMQSIPPHSGNLADLVQAGANKIGVTLILNDANEISYQARLKVTIEGQGITLRTRESFIPTPINLSFGVPVQLLGTDLAEYFDPNNLDFQGISRQSYFDLGGLPDGIYTICAEVYDFNRSSEQPGSNQACTVISAVVHDPPVVLSPIGTQTVTFPQNLPIQWQALHTASFPTEYQLEIYEWPYSSALPPDQVILNTYPFLTTTQTMLTTYLLGASDPVLEMGQRYLVRVRASDITMNNSFRNNGWSEIQEFVYGSTCGYPDGLQIDEIDHNSADFSWIPNAGYNKYVLRYREKLPGAQWYEDEILIDQHTIEELEERTTYEYQIQTLCNGEVAGDFSPLAEFTTDSIPFDQKSFNCGDAADFPRPDNTTPITSLNPGDYIEVAGFRAKLVEIISNGNGTWKGYAHVKVDWLGQNFYAQFKNLAINELKQVYDGNLVVKSEGLDALPGYISPDSIATLRDTAKYDFCGNLASAIKPLDAPSTDDVKGYYATHNPSSSAHFVPFDPAYPTTPNQDLFYDPYNPYNSVKPYNPTDYSDSNNPYTEENPYDASSMWNPYNHFNPYDPLNYDDPANPYSPEKPYDPEKLSNYATSDAFNRGLQTGALTLPYALPTIGASGKSYVVALDKMKFTPTGAIMNAFISLDLPKKGGGTQYLAFQMYGVQFHPGGLIGEAQLRLASDVVFNLSDKVRITFEAGKKTHVAFDCHGFAGVSVKGKVEFCENVIRPIDWETGMPKDSAYATGYFTMTAPEWGEFVADISMSPFEVPGLEQWTFFAQNMVFDFSESATPYSVQFPRNYEHPDVTGRMGRTNPEWTGFYMKALKVRLPRRFKKYQSNRDRSTTTTEQGTRGRSSAVSGDPDQGTRGRSSVVLEAPENRDSIWIAEMIASTADSSQIELAMENIIIDETGFTADISASKILPLDKGRVGSWGFAIDSVSVGIKQNSFNHAYLKGQVDVPAFKAPLGYQCLIQPGAKYMFGLSLQDSVEINAWRAQLKLYKDSEITFTYDEKKDQYKGGVKLNGKASFMPSVGDTSETNKDKLIIPSVAFQNFEILSAAPYVRVGTWAFSSGEEDKEKLTGFPLTINEVGMYQNMAGNEVEFRIGAAVHLVEDQANGFSGEGNIGIVSEVKIDSVTGRQTWKFKRVKVNKLALDVTGPAFKLKGSIEFYERKAVFGTGFRAMISAEFAPKIAVAALAQFGEVDDYRYWMADALIAFNPGLNIGTTGMALYGFGGGAYYHMKRTNFNSIKLPKTTTEIAASRTDSTTVTEGIDVSSDLGVSLSGAKYVPDKNTGLGIKAMVSFGATSREVFNGDLIFEITFNTNWGVDRIGFAGDLRFLTPPDTPESTDEPPAIRARIDMAYDVPNKSFHATLDMFVYVAKGVIRGAYTYPQHLAGTGVIHADPEDWYVYLGTPQKRVMLNIDVNGLVAADQERQQQPSVQNPNGRDRSNATTDPSTPAPEGRDRSDAVTSAPDTSRFELGNVGLLLTAYLDFGSVLPDFPPPPDRVASILGGGDFNITSRDDPRLANGGGFLFGASVDASAPDLKFMAFYASFYFGYGFDVMMANYGTAARCAGNEDSSSPIGINGWYATGQAYAYVEGTIGLNVDVFGVKGKYAILDIGAAAVLQARLPNPEWMKGTVGGYYSILNGLVSGNCKFDFELGEKCSIVGASELAGIKMIASTSPATDGETDVDVFIKPQAAFNIALGQVFELMDDDGNTNYYRARMKELSLKKVGSSDAVVVEETWNDKNDVVAFTPFDILEGNTDYVFTVNVEFDKKPEGGDWAPLTDSQGNLVSQSEVVNFTTGPAPDYIPHSNIEYSYPIIDQFNFLKAESSAGYIQLKQGQPYLFASEPEFALEGDWNQKVFYIQNDLIKFQSGITYNRNDRRVDFAIPNAAIENSTVTTIHLMNVPTSMGDIAVDSNVKDIVTDYAADLAAAAGQSGDDEFSTILVQEKAIEGALTNLEVTEFYTAHFRTSVYDTWAAKVNGMDLTDTWVNPIFLYTNAAGNAGKTIDDFGVFVKGVEQLDQFEHQGFHNGTTQQPALFQPEADLSVTGEAWYNSLIYPNIYAILPDANIPITWRTPTSILGVPPTKALTIFRNGTPQVLTEDEILSNSAIPEDQFTTLAYQIPYTVYQDHINLRHAVGNYLINNQNATYSAFHSWYFKYPRYGNYKVKLHYILPGQTTPNSSPEILINYGTTN